MKVKKKNTIKNVRTVNMQLFPKCHINVAKMCTQI